MVYRDAAGCFGKCGAAPNTRNLCIYDPVAQMAYALATSLASPASSNYDGIHGATLVGSKLYLAAESSVYGYPVVSVDLTGWTATTPVSGYTPVGSGGTNGRVDWILASPLGDRIYVGNNGELLGALNCLHHWPSAPDHRLRCHVLLGVLCRLDKRIQRSVNE